MVDLRSALHPTALPVPSFVPPPAWETRGGERQRAAVAIAVAALPADTPDSGDAQAGGVSPPFTVCARSWFEVWGSVWESEGGGWAGGRERVE